MLLVTLVLFNMARQYSGNIVRRSNADACRYAYTKYLRFLRKNEGI